MRREWLFRCIDLSPGLTELLYSLLSMMWSSPTEALKQHPYAYSFKGANTPFVTSIESGLPPGRPIKCYAYGSPCVASPDLQQYSRGLVISTVHNNDIVTTLSLGALRDLKVMAMNLHEDRENGTTQEIITRVLGLWKRKNDIETDEQPTSYSGRATRFISKSVASLYDRSSQERTVSLTTDEIAAGRGQNLALVPGYSDPSHQVTERSEEVEVNEWLWAVMRTLRASNTNDKLYPPGDVSDWKCLLLWVKLSDTLPGGPTELCRRELHSLHLVRVSSRVVSPS